MSTLCFDHVNDHKRFWARLQTPLVVASAFSLSLHRSFAPSTICSVDIAILWLKPAAKYQYHWFYISFCVFCFHFILLFFYCYSLQFCRLLDTFTQGSWTHWKVSYSMWLRAVAAMSQTTNEHTADRSIYNAFAVCGVIAKTAISTALLYPLLSIGTTAKMH